MGEGEARDETADRRSGSEKKRKNEHAVGVFSIEIFLLAVELVIENDGTGSDGNRYKGYKEK